MRQDEAGRWVSDNGRYLWSGSEWIDLQAPDAAADTDAGPTAVGQAAADQPAVDPGPSTGSGPAVSRRDRRDRRNRRGRRRRRPLLALAALLVLAAAAVGLVLFLGNRSDETSTSAVPSPDAAVASPNGIAASPQPPQALDEAQRRDRAEAALLTRTDLAGTTEQRPANPTDVFLPCRVPPLTPSAGTVLVGRTVSNSDFTVYAGQTIAGYPTARAAADALAQVRTAVQGCAPYDYRYANSPRVDRITHTDVDAALAVGDGGVYLVEVDTPANYAGSPTSYSYGYVQRGQFLVRLTLTNASKADRPLLEQLLSRSLSQLG